MWQWQGNLLSMKSLCVQNISPILLFYNLKEITNSRKLISVLCIETSSCNCNLAISMKSIKWLPTKTNDNFRMIKLLPKFIFRKLYFNTWKITTLSCCMTEYFHAIQYFYLLNKWWVLFRKCKIFRRLLENIGGIWIYRVCCLVFWWNIETLGL